MDRLAAQQEAAHHQEAWEAAGAARRVLQHRVSPLDSRGSHPELQGPRSTWLWREETFWGHSMLLGRRSMLRRHQGHHHVPLSTRHHCGNQLQVALGNSRGLHKPC